MDRAFDETPPLVVVNNVSRRYRQGATQVHALAGVSLAIGRGEFAALAGPSGSGKTTLLNLIGALDRPDQGTVTIGSTEVSAASAARRADFRLRSIGFVFQDYNLLPVLSALENVEFPLLLQRLPSIERRRRALTALTQVGLQGCENRRPSQLSGGQQQRVAVARALACQPLLILADEPTANLDSETGQTLIDLMRELNATHGTTFLFSTHDEMVMRHASRVIRMRDGHLVEARPHAVH